VEQGYHFASQLLDLPDPPTARLGGNNLLTMGALRAIRAPNLCIPDDIALVSFDDVPWMSLAQPAMTVVAQPTDEMGRVAAQMILDRIIKGPSRPATSYSKQPSRCTILAPTIPEKRH
jgi:DNA-binding LacI/PurR family transcriptional regulator